MSNSIFLLISFFIVLYALSFLSRLSLRVIFLTSSRFFKSGKIATWIITLIYLPGTFIHESAHAISATFLLLKVREFSIWPKYEKGALRLGYVSYEKKDVFRSILVGVSPVFLGIYILLWFAYLEPFSNGFNIYSIFMAYCLFVLTGTMFSSKQDMKDAIFILPLVIMLGLILFIFPQIGSNLLPYILRSLEFLEPYMYDVIWYMALACGIQFLIFLLLKSTFYKRHGR